MLNINYDYIWNIAQTNKDTKYNLAQKWMSDINGDVTNLILNNNKVMCIISNNPDMIHDFINDWKQMKTKINELYNELPEDKQVEQKPADDYVTIEMPKPQYICTLCDRKCINKFNLDKHMIACQSKQDRKNKAAQTVHKCDTCGKVFDNDYNKSAHVKAAKCKAPKPVEPVASEPVTDIASLIIPVQPRKRRSPIQ
jgi:hypothetical protein